GFERSVGRRVHVRGQPRLPHLHAGSDRYDPSRYDPRVQAAPMHEKADDFPVCVPRPSRTRLAQLDTLELTLADEESLPDERIQVDTPRYEIPPRGRRVHRETRFLHEPFDLLDLDERQLLPRLLAMLRIRVAITLEPGLGHGLDRVHRLTGRPSFRGNEYVLDATHASLGAS